MQSVRRAALISASLAAFLAPAYGLTPGQRAAVLAYPYAPAWRCDLTAGALCPGLDMSLNNLGGMVTDRATGFLTFAGNNQLLNSAALSTQTVTVATHYNLILSFYGTGSVVMSGASSATVNGTGANNQVFLAFAPSTTTLTLTVSGTVTNAVLAAVTFETAPRPQDQVQTGATPYFGPKLDANGLLIFAARTNNVNQSNNLSSGVWTRTNITAAKDQTGPDGVANSGSSILATAANGTATRSITLASSQRISSAYVKRLIGSGGVDMTQDGTTWIPITLTGAWTRVSIPPSTVTNPVVGFRIQTSGDKIAVYGVQNEGNAFVSPLLPTSGNNTTGQRDDVSFSGAPLAILQSGQASVVAETINSLASQASSIGVIGQIGGALYQPLDYYGLGTTSQGFSWSQSISIFTANTTPSLIAPNRGGIAFNAGGRSVTLNGGPAVSDGVTFSSPFTWCVGAYNTSPATFLSGNVRSLAVYRRRLPDSLLSRKTNVGAAY